MPSTCFVIGCSKRAERDHTFSFFRFPAVHKKPTEIEISKARRTAWLNAIKRKDLKESSLKYTRICSQHFITSRPAKLKDKLHPDWIPSLNMGYPQFSKPGVGRYQRLKNRTKLKDDVIPEVDPVVTPTVAVEVEVELSELEQLKLELKAKDETIKACEDKAKKLADQLKESTEMYEQKLQQNEKGMKAMAGQLKVRNMSITDFENNDSKVLYFTGIPNFTTLSHLFDFLKDYISSSPMKQINVFDAFMITLMKLRLDLPFTYLSFKYGVTIKTLSRIFHENVIVFQAKLSAFVHWPEKNALKRNTPPYFKKALGNNFTAIIDCFEVFTETPGDSLAKSEVFSSYKHHSTLKYLIAISPAGAIIFVSKGYGGRCSDKTVVESCGFTSNIEEGDIILSDRGMLVNRVIVEKGAKLLMPAFRNGRDQMDADDLERTRNLAKIRVHVERVIGLLRQKYLILTNRQPITATSKINGDEMYFDYIVKICCALTNLSPSIINLT
ncbi:uncharacterized protein LOC129942314 [Eupeodes corollae]|uniref:uncharacterized protein LOC129942314 n=1 Tax=Eupeodes corollae TaxID=290404 RepID=UPI0024915306|nr:uncharacterized protein LOC129942314 [Eupeodes corollae]